MDASFQDRTKILVCDDERVIVTTLHAILEQQGYQTAVAFSGAAAIEVARAFKPDLLLTDVRMPQVNGVEAALQIVSELPHCAVLLYSAYELPPDLRAAVKAKGFDFPLIQKPVAPNELLQKIRSAIRKRRTTFNAVVLNVDDNDTTRYAVTRMLTYAGFTVKEARNGKEALELAHSLPDLILLDINLPDMSGFEVCRQLKATPATVHIPVVNLTSTYRDDVAKAAAFEAGAEDYLTHPVQPDTLLAKIRELIRRTPRQQPR